MATRCPNCNGHDPSTVSLIENWCCDLGIRYAVLSSDLTRRDRIGLIVELTVAECWLQGKTRFQLLGIVANQESLSVVFFFPTIFPVVFPKIIQCQNLIQQHPSPFITSYWVPIRLLLPFSPNVMSQDFIQLFSCSVFVGFLLWIYRPCIFWESEQSIFIIILRVPISCAVFGCDTKTAFWIMLSQIEVQSSLCFGNSINTELGVTRIHVIQLRDYLGDDRVMVLRSYVYGSSSQNGPMITLKFCTPIQNLDLLWISGNYPIRHLYTWPFLWSVPLSVLRSSALGKRCFVYIRHHYLKCAGYLLLILSILAFR